MITLRPYQRESLDAIYSGLQRGVTRPVVVLSTGLGKTVIFAHLIKERQGRALVLAHREELLQQAADKIHMVNPEAHIGLVRAESNSTDADIIIGSVPTLARSTRRAQLFQPSNGNLFHQTAPISTVIVDEVQHAAAGSYQRIFADLDPNVLVLGVTATPDRADGKGLDSFFQEIVYERGMLWGIENNFLCDLKAIQIRIDYDANKFKTRAGDFREEEVSQALTEAHAPEHIAKVYQEHVGQRKGIVFLPSVQLAHHTAHVLSADGFKTEALDGATPREERAAILQRFKTGETQVVCNCAVLTEGFDEPSVDCIVIGRPTKSRPLYSQMVGRGTRIFPGKENCLIIDCVGVSDRLDLITLATLTGRAPKALAENGYAGTVARERQARAVEAQRAVRTQELAVREVELFAKTSKLEWHKVDGDYTLRLGFLGRLGVEPLGYSQTQGQMIYSVTLRKDGVMQTLQSGLSLDYAIGFGEDYARQSKASMLVDPDAEWRQKPASENQIKALKRFRVPHDQTISRGEASALLNPIFARIKK